MPRQLANVANPRGVKSVTKFVKKTAAVVADAIAHWRTQQPGGLVNLAALHEQLKHEHDHDGSLKSVQRYWKRTFPAPAIRARRRV